MARSTSTHSAPMASRTAKATARTLVTGTRKISSTPGHFDAPAQRTESGFTLIEIMVVVIIVGVIASAAFLSMGALRNDRALTDEARRFIALAGVALGRGGDAGTRIWPGADDRAAIALSSTMPTRHSGLMYWATTHCVFAILTDELEFELYLEGKSILLDDNPAEAWRIPQADESHDRVGCATHRTCLSTRAVMPRRSNCTSFATLG